MRTLENYLFKETAIVIHHGGEARRLSHITQKNFPKGMIEIGFKPRPLLDWVLAKYVDLGFKKFYITLWYKPEPVKERCKKIEDYTGIEFKFIEEPNNKRLGRGGAIKFGVEENIIKEENVLSVNGSDIISYDIKDFAQFHLSGLDRHSVTVLGSPYDKSIFGRIRYNKNGEVINFVEKPLIELKGEASNTGIFYLDKKAVNYLKEINEFPFNLEDDVFQSRVKGEERCYAGKIAPGKEWFWLKDEKDYQTWKNVDFEKVLGIKNIEKLLGPYKPKSLI